MPHYTTLQKFAARMNGTLLYRIVASCILLTKIGRLFVGIDSSGFKSSNASSYYTDRACVRKKYIKLSIGAELREQIACALKIRRAPKHDTIDFKPILERVSSIMPLSIVVADKGYDSEDNHALVREELDAISIIPARYEDVPIWRTHGRYRKRVKRKFHRRLYYQGNKNETILSVIKRMFREHITSRSVRMQNRELTFRVIAYNTHRLTVFMVWFLQSPKVCRFIYEASLSGYHIVHTSKAAKSCGTILMTFVESLQLLQNQPWKHLGNSDESVLFPYTIECIKSIPLFSCKQKYVTASSFL